RTLDIATLGVGLSAQQAALALDPVNLQVTPPEPWFRRIPNILSVRWDIGNLGFPLSLAFQVLSVCLDIPTLGVALSGACELYRWDIVNSLFTLSRVLDTRAYPWGYEPIDPSPPSTTDPSSTNLRLRCPSRP